MYKRQDVSKIASVTETEAEKMAEKVRKSGSSEGRAKQFRYKIAQTHDGKGSVVIFLEDVYKRQGMRSPVS